MSMSRKLFIPKAGQTHARYAAFRINGSLNYRGDCVVIDTTAPASQGASGVVAGETLGANDFIYVIQTDIATDATGPACNAVGFIEGLRVGDRNTTTALPNDGVIIVQVAGVFSNHAAVTVATDAVVGDLLLVNGASTDGAALPAAAIANSHAETAGYLAGIVLTTGATYTRGTVTTAPGCTAWVRCGAMV